MESRKIIIAEDNKDIASLITFKLKKEGFSVTHFLSGEGVVEGVIKTRPDLLITDIMMPFQNGIDILKEIRANPDISNIPIIILTSKGKEEDIITGLESGATEYIVKPFSPNELVARIKRILK
jgi:two-component system, OmpR family, alkaline phosphatase synthesis response regulator PhoP